jgi:hypothetical protein
MQNKKTKLKVHDHTERVSELQVNRLEIVIDDVDPDRVELYILNHLNERIEGGTFNRAAFMDHCMEFYHRHY